MTSLAGIRDQYASSDQYRRARSRYFEIHEDEAWPFVARMLRDADRRGRLLDVGCGGGDQLREYRKLGFENLFGIDPSRSMVQASRVLLNGSAQIGSGSWESMPFPNMYFSTLIGQYSLHYLSRLEGAFEEAYRVLADGGLLIFIVSHPVFDEISRCRENIEGRMCIRATVYDRQFEIIYFCHTLTDYLSPAFLARFDIISLFEFSTAIDDQENLPSGLGVAARRKSDRESGMK